MTKSVSVEKQLTRVVKSRGYRFFASTVSFFGALPVVLLLGACGQQSSSSEPLELSTIVRENAIVGGKLASTKDWVAHHIVGLMITDGPTHQQAICTGTIISEDTVMTAAHCMPDPKGSLEVRFGLKILDGSGRFKSAHVSGYKANELYKSHSENTKETHDIALVHFDGGLPAGFVPAEILQSDNVLEDGAIVTLSGYGVSNGVTNQGSGILRKVDVNILHADFSKSEVEIDQSASKGACYGDSGGPAFVQSGKQLFVWGVTSRGANGCASTSVYTKATAYRSWISKTMTALR